MNCRNRRYDEQAKAADRLEPKGVQSDDSFHVWGHTDIMTAGGETKPKSSIVRKDMMDYVKRGKPVFFHSIG